MSMWYREGTNGLSYGEIIKLCCFWCSRGTKKSCYPEYETQAKMINRCEGFHLEGSRTSGDDTLYKKHWLVKDDE